MANFEPQHAGVMATLRDLQQDPAFTDFTIHLKDGQVHVSRTLLAALSPVFRGIVSADETNNIAMKHITKETWTCIHEFYFGSQKLVTSKNVVDVLEASRQYQLDGLIQYCSSLSCLCSSENCLTVRELAIKIKDETLAQKAAQFICENFSAVCKSEDFLGLEKTKLLELLEMKGLVTTEDDMCEALLAWMEENAADPDTCDQLFKRIKLRLVSNECLGRQGLQHGDFTNIPEIQCKLGLELTKRTTLSPTGLVVIGGEYYIKVFLWSEDKKDWIVLNVPIQQSHQHFAATLVDDRVFITGGYCTDETYFFDLKNCSLTTGPRLEHGDTWNHEMTVIGSKAFIVSGRCEDHPTEAIYEYSEASGRWTKIGELRFATETCGVTTLGDTIIVAGGSGCNTERLIQTFSVETRTAAVLDDRLPRPMYYVGAASLGNTAFFVGNEGDLVQVKEVEGKFQITSHTLLQRFGQTRSSFGLYVTDDCLHVVGRTVPATVECWDFQGRKKQNASSVYPPLPICVDVKGAFQLKLHF